jgi:AraC-like DNA-binding protein
MASIPKDGVTAGSRSACGTSPALVADPVVVTTLRSPGIPLELRAAIDFDVSTVVDDVDELVRVAGSIRNGIALFDAETFPTGSDLRSWRTAQRSSWSTVLSVEFDARAALAALTCLREWPVAVMVQTHKAPRIHARALLDRAAALRQSCRMLAHLPPQLTTAAPPFALRIITAYASPFGPASLKELAAVTGRGEHRTGQLLRAIRIPSSYLFFSASRVLRAWDDVAMAELPIQEIARRWGFGTRVTLHSEWEDVTGMSVRAARGVELSDARLEAIAARVF